MTMFKTYSVHELQVRGFPKLCNINANRNTSLETYINHGKHVIGRQCVKFGDIYSSK